MLAAVLATAAVGIIAVAVLYFGEGRGYQRRLTPEMAEQLAGKQAHDPRSFTLMGCKVVDFLDEERVWLVECHQDGRTRWLVNDETGEVRPEGEGASGSPTEGPG